MHQAVDGSHRHAGVWEHAVPAREWLVGRDQDAAPLVAFGDQLEQHAGLGLVLPDVRQIVQDEQVIAVELGQRLGQLQALAGCLQALHELAGTHVQHPAPGVDQGVADPATHMALAHTRRAEDQDRGALVEPGIAAGQRHDVRLRQHRHLGEVEAGECFGHVELGLGTVTLDAPLGPLGEFMFEQTTQETGCRPALLVRAFGELRPQPAHGGQAQFGQHQRIARRVLRRRGHAVASANSAACWLGSSAT